MQLRRTKILTTLGPATDKPGVLEELFEAGIDVVRLNFSHGSAQDHIDRANRRGSFGGWGAADPWDYLHGDGCRARHRRACEP